MAEPLYQHPLLNKDLPTVDALRQKCGDLETRKIFDTACTLASWRYNSEKSIRANLELLSKEPCTNFDPWVEQNSFVRRKSHCTLNEIDLLRALLHHRWDFIEENLFRDTGGKEIWPPAKRFYITAEYWADIDLPVRVDNMPGQLRTGWGRRWLLLFLENPHLELDINLLLSSTADHFPPGWAEQYEEGLITSAESRNKMLHTYHQRRKRAGTGYRPLPRTPPLHCTAWAESRTDGIPTSSRYIIPGAIARLPLLMEKFNHVPPFGFILGFYCQVTQIYPDIPEFLKTNTCSRDIFGIPDTFYPIDEKTRAEHAVEIFFSPEKKHAGLLIDSPFKGVYEQPFTFYRTARQIGSKLKMEKVLQIAGPFFEKYIGTPENLKELFLLHHVAEQLSDQYLPDIDLSRVQGLTDRFLSGLVYGTGYQAEPHQYTPTGQVPDNYEIYKASIKGLPRPSIDQVARFASHVAENGRWNHHLFPIPKVPFYFYLDATAGLDKQVMADGTTRFAEIKTQSPSAGSKLTTEEYRNKFGYLSFQVDHSLRAKLICDAQGAPIPEKLMEAGKALLSSFLSPVADFSLSTTCRQYLADNKYDAERVILDGLGKALPEELPGNMRFYLSAVHYFNQENLNKVLEKNLIHSGIFPDLDIPSTPWKDAEQIIESIVASYGIDDLLPVALEAAEIKRGFAVYRDAVRLELEAADGYHPLLPELERIEVIITTFVQERVRQLSDIKTAIHTYLEQLAAD